MNSPEKEIVDLTMDEEPEDAREMPNSQATITAAENKPQDEEPVTDEPPAYSEDDDDGDDEVPIIPSLEEQRAAVNALIELTTPLISIGTPLYIIPAAWYNDFLHAEFKDAADAQVKLRSINTHGIIKEGGLFCDQSTLPLTALHEKVFERLREWYGLAQGCSPVVTYAVQGEDGPVPEFSKPCFHLHHLISDATNTPSSSHFGSSYTSIPMFSISRLHNFEALVQLAIQTLAQKEHLNKQPGFENKKFRIWIIRDDNESSLDYLMTTSTFMNLNGKYLVKKEYLSQSIESTNVTFAHICIEEKIVMTPPPPPPPRNAQSAPGSVERLKIRSYWPSLYLFHFPPTPSDGRIGLQNLGNTCYMNSALQCLVHIPELTQYFLFGCYHTELNADNPLGYEGKVALSFANLIHHLFDKKPNRGNYYIPRDFKSTIGYSNDMFSGYQQQDSQEFLAFLLDCLHEDLNRIIKKPMTTKQELSDHEDAQNMTKVAELAEKSWELYKLRNDSIVTDLFVGMYKSTLVCPVCDKISITFDPFNDLTLPLFVDQVWERSIVLFLEDGHIKKFDVELQKTATYDTLKKYVADKLGLNVNHLFTAEVWNHQFYKNFESSESQSAYLPLSELMAAGDDIVMYEVRHSEGDLIIPVLNTVNPPSNVPDSFGLPFFISVTEEERKSFGVIRQKLEHRYEQLSTFKYFSKVRSTQDGDNKFTLKDFPLLSKAAGEDDDLGYDSDVSLANPDISGDYAFTIKVFDSTREVKNRSRRSRFQRGHARSTSEEKTEKVWMPSTQNNFTRLPSLLDCLDEKKRSLYTYAKKVDLYTSTSESGEVSTPSSSMDKELMDIIDTGIDDLKTSHQEGEEVQEHKTVGNASDDDDDNSPEMDIEPLTADLSFPSNDTPVDEVPSQLNDALDSPILSQDLVGPHVALVCEWDAESFETFFVGSEGEGEDGKETWTQPEVIANEEVEESKKLRAAKKNEVLTLDKCLELFSKPEVLSDHDLWRCSNCQELRAATKQIQIWNTPDILTIHLKRFQNQRSFSDKIDAVVDFPIEGLDMSSHLASPVMHKDGAIYDLFAVDHHYGGIGGGHYTAYAKNFVDNKWYYYNDSHVSEADPIQSISGAAYLLFYKRRSSDFLGGEHFAQMLEAAREEHDEREKKIVEVNESFYRDNLDSDEDDDDEEEDDFSDLEDVSESVSEEDEYEPVDEVKVKRVTAPMIANELDEDSSDNVSVPVGSEDCQRRKQRLISRGKGPSIDRTALFSDPDADSMGPASPISVNSDDNSSTYSSTVNAPVHLR